MNNEFCEGDFAWRSNDVMRVINVFSNGSSVIWFDILRCSIVVIGIGVITFSNGSIVREESKMNLQK